ncbi:MAG: hypothetical protein OEW35_03790 [Gammaproteobacteria bacterium]|nr:hypothetical protein [Gammaproteobacteria bacterium]MDH4253478.1 hypothetical protein [Gammaproteobacteria bacterium]MDH5309711.1 hypothetical protein [Gammaproteobacteria bacterium]
MKHSILSFAAIMLLAGPSEVAWPQDADASREQVEAARQMVREGARQFIDDELLMTDEEAAKFWPLYDEYRAEVIAVEDEYVDLIRDFLRKYDAYALTDADADAMTDRFFDIKIRVLQARQKFLPRFREVLPGMKVMRMYQLENKVQAEIDATLALLVPLADPS